MRSIGAVVVKIWSIQGQNVELDLSLKGVM